MKKLLLTLACSALMLACSEQEDLTNVESSANSENFEILPDSVAQRQFAQILSRAVYNEPALREFIKTEALKQFDNDYDVFYPILKDNYVDSRTFKEILASYCTENENLNQIEASLPLLNILVPDLSIANAFTANNWDTSDPEVAVSYVNGNKQSTLYCDGLFAMNMEEGELPSFPILVVNKSYRMRIANKTRSINPNETEELRYTFADPIFDGTKSNMETRTAYWDKTNPDYTPAIPFLSQTDPYLDQRVITAYNENLKKDTFIQRDYIYYGLTLNSPTNGELYTNMCECLYKFKISPSAYYTIADQSEDAQLNHHEKGYGEITHKATSLSSDKIIDKIWKKGAFTFNIDIYIGERDAPTQKTIQRKLSASAQETFAIDTIHVKKNGANAFHHSKYTYTVKVTDLKAKWITPHLLKGNTSSSLLMLTGSPWDISNNSVKMMIAVTEVDQETTETVETKMSNEFVNKGDFSFGSNGTKTSIKLGLGYSYTSKTETTYTLVKNNKSDDLGNVEISFKDPIIIPDRENTGNGYKIYTYNTGSVEMMILPVRKF